MFWKTIKPLLLDTSCITDSSSLSEKGEILKIESETAESLNNFFFIYSKESEYFKILCA